MIRAAAIAIAIALSLGTPATAQRLSVVAGLSQERVSIGASFDGTEILIYGAVKREQPIIAAPPLAVILTVAGPDQRVTVRRKERLAGIWVNRAAVEVDRAPSFYAVASSGPLDQVLRDTDDLRHRITTRRAIRSVGAPMEIADAAAFTEALIRIRQNDDLYQTNPRTVRFDEQTLFSANIALPANLVEGNYRLRIFLTRDGEVVKTHEEVLFVQKVGLERFLYLLAHERPLIYGLLAVAVAVGAGWGASAAVRAIRG